MTVSIMGVPKDVGPRHREVFPRDEVKMLILAYEDLTAELGEVYYNQDGEAIKAAVNQVNNMLENMGFTDDDWK